VSIVQATVPFWRANWASRFIDFAVATRVVGTVFNPDTGQTELTYDEVYAGEALIRPAEAREIDFGEARRQLVDYDLYLPWDSDQLAEGDVVAVVSDLDPLIPELSVLRGFTDTYLTRRHYETKHVTDPFVIEEGS
jgi:hypothetical protein